LDEKADASADQRNQALVSGTSRKSVTPKYDRASIIIAAFTLFAALGLTFLLKLGSARSLRIL
jgi:hypothetical protein